MFFDFAQINYNYYLFCFKKCEKKKIFKVKKLHICLIKCNKKLV